MKSKKSATKKQSADNKIKLVTSDIVAIIIFSMNCVISLVLSIFFFIISVSTRNQSYLILTIIYFIVSIVSLLFLFKFSNKGKNEQTTNRIGTPQPQL